MHSKTRGYDRCKAQKAPDSNTIIIAILFKYIYLLYSTCQLSFWIKNNIFNFIYSFSHLIFRYP